MIPKTKLIGVLGLSLILVLTGCVPQVPPDAFNVSEEMMKSRQIESRKFTGISEEEVLVASSNVLQDMGYNLENTEVQLGVLTANKQRDATNAGEIAAAIILGALFRAPMAVSKDQTIRASLVVKPAGSESVIATLYAGAGAQKGTIVENTKTAKGKKSSADSVPNVKNQAYIVRVTFQRIVRKTDNSTYAETIKDPEIYQEFFDKLSKSVFIEAQQL